ncbi:hypothetical protein ACFL2A_07595 [Thermodesulfobacteriota bacterium]
MDRVLKKIISIISYFFLMYISYNVFMPESSLFKKSTSFLEKQESIVQYEELTEGANSTKSNKGYHKLDGVADEQKRARFACEECHGDIPHKENPITRAYNNMHTYRLSCLACHISKKDRKKVKFGWVDAEMNVKKDGSKEASARITPYIEDDSKLSIIEYKIKDHGDLENKYKIKIEKMENLACKNCHAKKGRLLFDLSSLGYGDEDKKRLRNLDETTMYDRKDNWRYLDFM